MRILPSGTPRLNRDLGYGYREEGKVSMKVHDALRDASNLVSVVIQPSSSSLTSSLLVAVTTEKPPGVLHVLLT